MFQAPTALAQTARLVLLSSIAVLLAACGRNEAAPAPAAPPAVTVAEVVTRPITEFDEFTGRIEAVERVEIRPRVSGYISSVNFTEGAEVRAGDVLFVIDPRPYDAELKRAEAERARALTALSLATSERERAVRLLDLKAISQEEFDARVAGSEQAAANVQVAEAAVDAAALNLTFTRVRAPISGLVGKAAITAGNLVTGGQTPLTTLVSIDPVYVEFEGDERVYLKYAELTRQGVRADSRAPDHKLWIGLADENGYPHEGRMVFLDNVLDPATGTIRARGRLDNSDRRFTPGLFARVRLAGTDDADALLIRDSAVGTDQSVRYVLVVGAENKVEYRAVKLGPLVDGLRVVREGLASGEQIVVNGLQRARPGMAVAPERVAMELPVSGPDSPDTTLVASTQAAP